MQVFKSILNPFLAEAIIIPSMVATLSTFYIFVCILFFYEVA